MTPITAIVVTLAVLLLSLYVVWRIRYGFPPRDDPRVLCFHKVTRRFQFEGTWTTPARFAATIDRLVDRGYRFIGEDEYLRTLRDGGDDGMSLLLTFDDAYEDVYDAVLPLLSARSIPFLVFVVTDYPGAENRWDLSLGRPPRRHASWSQLGEMVDAGADIGSHTGSHPDLTRLDDEAATAELARSREAIAGHLGVEARTLSYPFGRYDDRMRRIAEAVGFEAAFSLYPRHRNEVVDRYALRRNGVYIIDPSWWVERKLERNSWFWLEEMKCRAINGVAVLTPLLRRSVPGRAPGNEDRSGPGSTRATG